MRKLLWSLVFIFAAFMPAAHAADFQDAVAKYEAGQFKEAAAGFEQMAQSGRGSAAVYYNLGNAYFRLGQKGKALLAYDRAHSIAPRDEEVLWNREIVKSALADRIEENTDSVIWMWTKNILDRFSADEAAKLFSALLAALLALTLLSWAWRPIRGFAGALQTAVLILIFAVSVLFGFKWFQIKDPRVVVLEKEVFARFGPNLKETKAFLLHEGAEARMLDETNGWVYIVLPNKNSGWIPKEACEKI